MADIDRLVINGNTMESIYAKIGISYERFVELLDRDFYTPTLTSAPTTSTRTYTDTDGSVCEFRIGQFCRVADSSIEGGYKIYQCVDIKSGVGGTFISWQADMASLKEYINNQLDLYAKKNALSNVAFSGSYKDLSDKPDSIDSVVTGVKGDSETTYRTGEVNIKPADLGITVVNNTADDDKNVRHSVSADSATKDSLGNKISDTYATKNELSAAASNASSQAADALSTAKTYTDNKISALINGAPETLDTLDEIAAALKDNDDIIDVLNESIGNKVDKVSGKGLSTNDYTTSDKNKLSSIEQGAQVNTITGIKGNAESTYRTGDVNLTPANLGITVVNNTADSNKSVKHSTTSDSATNADKIDGYHIVVGSVGTDSNTIYIQI